MYFQFDDIRFEGLYGPSILGYRKAARIPTTPLIYGKAALLFTGGELDEYKMDILLHHTFVNVQEALDSFTEKLNTGKVCAFVDGTGLVLGDFVITSIEVGVTESNAVGRILGANLQVSLVEYVPIAANEPQRGRAFDEATALSENPITPVAIDALPSSPEALLSAAVLETRSDAAIVERLNELVVTAPAAQKAPLMARIKTQAEKVTAAGRKILAVVDRVQTIAGQVPLTRLEVESLLETAATLRDAAERGDITDVSNATGGLLSQVDGAFVSTRPFNTQLILRRL